MRTLRVLLLRRWKWEVRGILGCSETPRSRSRSNSLGMQRRGVLGGEELGGVLMLMLMLLLLMLMLVLLLLLLMLHMLLLQMLQMLMLLLQMLLMLLLQMLLLLLLQMLQVLLLLSLQCRELRQDMHVLRLQLVQRHGRRQPERTPRPALAPVPVPVPARLQLSPRRYRPRYRPRRRWGMRPRTRRGSRLEVSPPRRSLPRRLQTWRRSRGGMGRAARLLLWVGKREEAAAAPLPLALLRSRSLPRRHRSHGRLVRVQRRAGTGRRHCRSP